MVAVPKIKLNNGTEIPAIGLGTYTSKSNEGEEAIKQAIDKGYRHIDTALFYENEKEVGNGIRAKIAEGVVKREDIYLVTKLWGIHHEPAKVEHACQKSLENLGLDYIDLYLMHWPVGFEYIDDETLLPRNDKDEILLNDVDYLDTWKAMEQLVKKGLVRSIGFSNFNSKQIERIFKNCEIKPVAVQVECHLGFNQKKLIEFSKSLDLVVVAFYPLGHPKAEENKPAFLYDDKVKAIGLKYSKTPAQVALRYLIQIGTVPIPKSTNKSRIDENFEIFDFELNTDDMEILNSLQPGERIMKFAFTEKHKYYPFGIEF